MKVITSNSFWPFSESIKKLSKIILLCLLMNFLVYHGQVQALEVTKTTSTYITEQTIWDIDKYADFLTIDVKAGESFSVSYYVDVFPSIITNYSVDGSISVYNPSGTVDTIISIVDEVSGGIVADVDFDPNSIDDIILGPGWTNEFSYTAELPDSSIRVNTATVISNNFIDPSTATAIVNFSDATFESIDSSAVISDSLIGFLGLVDGPASFYYEVFFDPFYEAGTYNIFNTAYSQSSDTNAVREDSWGITVNVTPVPEPSTFLLLGSGLAGMVFVVRRRKKE